MAFKTVRSVCLICAIALPAAAQDHDHKPIVVPSKPVISRIKVSYAVPHRVRIDGANNVLVADTRAGVVFRTAPDGITAVLANGLKEPVALASDEDGNVYIATAAKGQTAAGHIYKVTPDGDRETLHSGLTGLSDIARDQNGVLTVALEKQNRVIALREDGNRVTLSDRIKRPTALAHGQNGELFIASRAGQIWQLLPGKKLRKLADGLKSPSDMAVAPDGRLVIAATGERKLTVIKRGEQPKTFANVLPNTISVAFSKDGNMVVANSEQQSVTRVTSRFKGVCTHDGCNAEVKIIFKRPQKKRSAF